MSFEELPSNIRDIPLVDRDHIANVLDLFVRDRDRYHGAVLLLLCDEERRPLQPIMLEQSGGYPDPTMIPRLREMAGLVAADDPGLTMLCAIARRGWPRATSSDVAWQQMLGQAFEGRLAIIGVHVITPRGSAPLAPLPAAA